MGEFDGRAAGRAAGEHIGDVTRKVTAFVNDEPDRLMHLATQTGFILPSDQRYQRFLTPEQIDTFNRNMADNADLVRAHAEEYRRDKANERGAAGELDYKRYLGNADLDDPTGLRDLMLIGNEPGTKAEAERKRGLWGGGAREGVASFGRQHGWTPAEIEQRQRMGDRRFGYTPPAPAPGPANGGGPAPAAPAAPSGGGMPAAPAAPAADEPVARTAGLMSGQPAYGSPARAISSANVPAGRAQWPGLSGTSMGTTPDEAAFGDSFVNNGIDNFRAMIGMGPRAKSPAPAGPVVTKQPGQPGALTPEQKRAYILSLGQ
jgi:hypothetical protein